MPGLVIGGTGHYVGEGWVGSGDAAGGGPILVDLTNASETDTAVGLDVDKLVTLALAGETDTAPGLDFDKLVTLGFASETDTAIGLSITHTIIVTLTPSTETDSAQLLDFDKRVTLVLAPETNSAVGLSFAKAFTLAPGLETDTAPAFTFLKRVTLAPATELDESILTLIYGCADPYRICDFPNVAAALAAGWQLMTVGYNIGKLNEEWIATFEKRLNPSEMETSVSPVPPGYVQRHEGSGPNETAASLKALACLNYWRDGRYDVAPHPISLAPRGGHEIDVT